ncbi:MAG: SprB repeat-containing protein [Bacteroidetes bacterium]|nr:SprB repeat-containing protein [Bacteroidota bacterium]
MQPLTCHRAVLCGLFLLCVGLASAADPIILTLTPSDHNGYNISCNGGKDGAIDLTITGGTAPYTIGWSTKEETEDISGLSAGYYKVYVKDADGTKAEAEITLVEPSAIKKIDVFKLSASPKLGH